MEISSVFENWNQDKYDDVERELHSRGFSDIKCNRIATDNGVQNKNITSIQIGDSEETKAEYTIGDCYVSTRATIWIEHYVWNIVIGEKPKAFVGKNYEDVVRNLKAKGFSNIVLKRSNDASSWGKKEAGNVKSIKVNGNEKFDKDDIFEFDVPIEIVVYTKETGYDEITLVEE